MIVYHGSKNIIVKPIYKGSKPTNDYGYGFYCTEDYNLACEWAAKSLSKVCYTNKYDIDTKGLKILNLCSKEYSILNWLAILLKFRTFYITPRFESVKQYIINRYYVDVDKYDIVIGYRADDSYFKYAKDFVSNSLSYEKLSQAMKYGRLGIQVVFISQEAINKLKFVEAKEVDYEKHFQSYIERDLKARHDYLELEESIDDTLVGTFILDIIRRGESNENK